MANSGVAVKAQQAAALWRHDQYESNKKAQAEEETKACQHVHTEREEKDWDWARASRVNLHSWTMAH